MLAVFSSVRFSSSSSTLLIYCYLLSSSVFIITAEVIKSAEVNEFNTEIII
jgi:hypothetical protein